MSTRSDKKYLEQWEEFRDNISKSTPVDLNETASEKDKRIKRLEANYEEWFKYYFPNFYKSEPAKFHIRATKRILTNPEWYEVRSWSRELAKTTRTMMEVLYLALTGKKKNIILVSHNLDNAEDLLKPYKTILESNNRIINDYGTQESLGEWESYKFKTKKGVSFRALGSGQSPRGKKNDEARPDVILIDDIDTDEECRNKDRIKDKVNWIEQALIPARSISEPLLILACGNVIAKYCCITEMGKKADKWEIINIRDKNGKSTWPAKNTEADIDRVLSLISNLSAQKEYYNNPLSVGEIFKELTWGKCPTLRTCDKIIVYADPSPSNNARTKSSSKAVGIIAQKGLSFYIYRFWMDNVGNAIFMDWLYEACKILDLEKVDPKRVYVENNSLQNPFYEQVLIPLRNQLHNKEKYRVPLRPDNRKKPDKNERIEGTLEPLNREGNLIFNVDRKEDPHFVRLEEQFLTFTMKAKDIDGPDCVEGGVWLLEKRVIKSGLDYATGTVADRGY